MNRKTFPLIFKTIFLLPFLFVFLTTFASPVLAARHQPGQVKLLTIDLNWHETQLVLYSRQISFSGQRKALKSYYTAIQYIAAVDLTNAAKATEASLRYWPDLPPVNRLMAEIKEHEGEIKGMEKYYRRYLKYTQEARELAHLDPDYIDVELSQIEDKFAQYGIDFRWRSWHWLRKWGFKIPVILFSIGLLIFIAVIFINFIFSS